MALDSPAVMISSCATILPVAFATAHLAAQFIKFFPRETEGVFPQEALPVEVRRAILAGVKKSGVKIAHKVTALKPAEDDSEM